MMTEPQIVWRGLTASASLEARIREEIALVDKIDATVTALRVVVEIPSQGVHHARYFRVKLELLLPGRQLNVTNDETPHKRTTDAHIAVAEAFTTLRDQLRDHAQSQRQRVRPDHKAHSGVVTKLQPDRGFGFIAADEGGEIYFHKNSVLDNAWERMLVGDHVRFHPEQGDQGPQASSVHFERH